MFQISIRTPAVHLLPLLLVGLVVGLAACGGEAPSIATDQAAATRRAIPKAVLDFEALAEDTYDTALRGDVAGVQRAAGSMGASWKRLRKTMQRDGLRAAALKALDKSVAQLSTTAAQSKDALQLARAANAVTDPMDDVFELYHPKAPPTLMSLDFLGRELVLDSRGSGFAAAAKQLSDLRKEWSGLRGKVIKAGGTDQASADCRP